MDRLRFSGLLISITDDFIGVIHLRRCSANLSKVDMKTEPQQFIGELGAFSKEPKTKETNRVSNSLLHSLKPLEKSLDSPRSEGSYATRWKSGRVGRQDLVD